MIEETKLEETFREPTPSLNLVDDEEVQRHSQTFQKIVIEPGKTEEVKITSPNSNKEKVFTQSNTDSSSVEIKTGGLVKPIALVAMAIMAIFALVYIVDLITFFFQAIGGIF